MGFERMLRYCTALELNNDRAWFHTPENHKLYEAAKQDFTDLVAELKFRIADRCAPDLAEGLIFADPKALQYRIPRDMRANKGKPPYNPRWGADLSADRHSLLPIGYYVHIQPGNRSLFGTGAYCWDSELLLKVRSYLSENAERFFDALDRCGYPMFGDKLKNVPRGFDPDDPASEYLKFKSWLAARHFEDSELTTFDRFLDDVCDTVDRMEPLRLFFSDALTGKRKNPFDPSDWD